MIATVTGDMNAHMDATGNALGLPATTIDPVKATLAGNLMTFQQPVLGVMANLLKSADDLLAKGVWYGDFNMDGTDFAAHLPKVNQFAGF